MLADNVIYLKKQNPALYDAMKKEEETVTKETVFLEKTRNNQLTLKIVKDDKTNYLHSKYEPLKEASTIIDKLEEQEELTKDTHLIFYGLGLGYHIDAFVNRYPNVDFSIYEPSLEVLSHYLRQKSLSHLPVKNFKGISGEYCEAVSQAFFDDHIGKMQKQIIFCQLPAYETVFKKQYNQFFEQAKMITKNKRGLLHSNYAFKKRWILNSVINFGEVLSNPNIIMENSGLFKDKSAILVSAGPSLDFEIENLKRIKEKGLAYIFSVGSAINTLIRNEIYPDAMCTYDPKETNQIVFNQINAKEINTIPMIFGSSVGFETIQQYKGPKYTMLTNQDTVSGYFLKTENGKKLETVQDAPSIAVVTLELLSKLEFGEVILVGQNLAYLNKKNYAYGIDYHLDDEEINEDGLVKALDVIGETIYTTDSYLSMKNQMEHHIKNMGLKVINTTQGGIDIKGTEFIPMDQVIIENLLLPIVDGSVFDKISHSQLYDQEYLKRQWLNMKQAYTVYLELLAVMKQHLLKIDELVKNKNGKQAGTMYQQFDNLVVKLEANEFAKVFALPMNRVEHELLAIKVQQIKNEKNELKRVGDLVLNVAAFIGLLYGDNHLNQQIMSILDVTFNNLE